MQLYEQTRDYDGINCINFVDSLGTMTESTASMFWTAFR